MRFCIVLLQVFLLATICRALPLTPAPNRHSTLTSLEGNDVIAKEDAEVLLRRDPPKSNWSYGPWNFDRSKPPPNRALQFVKDLARVIFYRFPINAYKRAKGFIQKNKPEAGLRQEGRVGGDQWKTYEKRPSSSPHNLDPSLPPHH